MIDFVTWPPLLTKSIIVVTICYKLLCHSSRFLISNFLASTDIKVFGRTYVPIYNAASDWPRTFFTPKVFLFSISLLFWKYKQMLLLASSCSREVLHGHNSVVLA